MSIFVTASAGTEKPLKAELRALGLRGIKGDRGGVHVHDERAEAVGRICLGTRVGIRVLVEVGRFRCPHEDALYDGISAITWERWLSPDHTLAVSATSREEALAHTGYVAQKTKDAIVDRQRKRFGRRSSVDRRDADVGIFVRIAKGEAAVFLDASGGSLHQRGWRTSSGEAPLKETLAAAMLRLSGWDGKRPLIDPMCGSGTLPIEADLWTRRVPPQSRSRQFGFERWADHDETRTRQMKELRQSAAERQRSTGPECFGFDHDAGVLDFARGNAERARARARFRVRELRSSEPAPDAHVISNPPYGHRLEAPESFWRELRQAIDQITPQAVSLLLPIDAPRVAAPPHARRHRLSNGKLQCHLVTW